MKKKEKVKSDSGLHEIKNKKRVRPVKDKKRHVALKRVKAHRKAKAVASLLLVGVVAISFAFMGGDPDLNIVSRDFLTVCYQLPSDGSTPLDYSGRIENIGFMNYRLKTQPNWYSHMHSNVSCADNQTVDTYKQYSNGILIQTDTAVDSMNIIHEAQQFCWVLDPDCWVFHPQGGVVSDFTEGELMWNTTKKIEAILGNKVGDKIGLTEEDVLSGALNIPWSNWKERDYSFNHRSIEHFTYGCAKEGEEEPHKQEEINGLPGTAFSVYVINDETLLSAGDVIDNGDGTYSQTFELRVSPTGEEDDSAVCHYKNQMVFKGGLDELPSFSSVTITYTFDSTWQVFSSIVKEKYNAKSFGINASCTATNYTEYSYSPELSYNPAYENYYQFMYDKPEVSKQLTPEDYLMAAFAPIINEPTSLQLALNIDGYKLNGLIRLDLSAMDFEKVDLSKIDVRASVQNDVIRLYYIDNEAYLSYGGIKIKLNVGDLMTLLGGEETPQTLSNETKEGGFSIGSLMNELVGEDKELKFYDKEGNELESNKDGNAKKAEFATSLDLSSLVAGLKISDLIFYYNIGDDKSVSLDHLDAIIQFGDIEIGASMAFTDQKVEALNQAEKEEFIEFSPYVESVINLVKEDVLCVTVSYANAGFNVNGTIQLSYRNGFALAGDLFVTYNDVTKKVSLAYLQDTVYVNLDGICVKASTQQLEEFIGKFVDSDGTGNFINGITDGLDFKLADVLEKVLSKDFRAIGITEENKQLNVVIKVTQILEIFGVSFDGLDQVSFAIGQEGSISLEALGATVGVSKGSQVTFDTEGYADILPYANDLLDLFTGEEVDIAVNYSSDSLSVNGTVCVLLGQELKVKGDLTVVYAGAEIPVNLYFADGELYLNAYGLKVKADTQKLLGLLSDTEPKSNSALITTILEMVQSDSPDVKGAVEKIAAQVFAYSFGDLIAVSESNGALNIVLDGSDLLKLFLGTNMKLGDISLTVQNGVLGVSAFGADILTVTSGTAFADLEDPKDLEDYEDITEIVLLIPDILEKGALSLGGEIEFNVGDFTLSLAIVKGAVSWTNGFELYLDTYFGVNGIQQEIILKASTSTLQIVYGDVFLEVAFDELDALDQAFVKLYNTIDATLDEMIVQGSPMPEIEKFTDLLTVLGGMLKAKEVLLSEGKDGGFDIGGIIKAITISASDSENGICKISYNDISVELFGGESGVALKLGYLGKSFSVSANLEADLSDTDTTIPTMPEDVIPLTVESFAALLDYVGAAVRTLTETDIAVDIWGETKNVETDHTVTSVSGTVFYHRNVGDKAVFTIDLDETKITVAPDLYLDISLQIVSNNGGTSTYVDVLVFDYDGNEELDFFVSLSMYDFNKPLNERDPKCKPLKIYAPAGEIMTVLSSGLMLFGIDVDILNNYLVYDWLNMQTVEQLKAFGSMLTMTMQLDGDTLLQGILAALKDAVGDANAKVLKDTFVKAIVAGDEEFKVTLNSASVYEKAELENLSFSVLKGNGENGTLRGVTLYNVYSGDCKEVTNVKIGFNTEKIEEDSLNKNISVSGKYSNNYYDGYYDFSGIGDLVKAIANTATHTATEEEIAAGKATSGQQVINTNYYATGTINANLFGSAAVSIKTALSVDLNKDGKGGVVIKLRLNYEGYKVLGLYSIINGKQNQLDLTIDLTEMMVYMERNSDGTVIDRAMPLSVFANDILGQFAFILNFSDDIASAMTSDSSASGETAVVDYGEMIGTYLKGYSYDVNKHTWSVTLNGDGLTGGVIGDINLSIGAEEESENNNALALNSIGASMKLQLDSLVNGFLGTILKAFTITIDTGNHPLTIWNASEKGTKDYDEDNVTNLAEEFKDLLGEVCTKTEDGTEWKLTDDNGNATYFEGTFTTVHYMLEDLDGTRTEVGTQRVLYSGSGANFKLYTTLVYPEVPAREGYTLVWSEPNQELITATYQINLYDVTFVANEKLGDGWVETENGKYVYNTEMYYGSTIELVYGDGRENVVYTVDIANNVFELPVAEHDNWTAIYISSEEARFVLTPDRITYSSDVAFSYGDQENVSGFNDSFKTDYTLITDLTAEGYTFLGWWYQDENGNWTQVTSYDYLGGKNYEVEALWQKTKSNVDSVDASKSYNGWTVTYTVNVTVHNTDCELMGAWMNDSSVIKQVKYEYVIKTATVGKKVTGESDSNQFSDQSKVNVPNGVTVTVITTYTASDGRILYSESAEGSNRF